MLIHGNGAKGVTIFLEGLIQSHGFVAHHNIDPQSFFSRFAFSIFINSCHSSSVASTSLAVLNAVNTTRLSLRNPVRSSGTAFSVFFECTARSYILSVSSFDNVSILANRSNTSCVGAARLHFSMLQTYSGETPTCRANSRKVIPFSFRFRVKKLPNVFSTFSPLSMSCFLLWKHRSYIISHNSRMSIGVFTHGNKVAVLGATLSKNDMKL